MATKILNFSFSAKFLPHILRFYHKIRIFTTFFVRIRSQHVSLHRNSQIVLCELRFEA